MSFWRFGLGLINMQFTKNIVGTFVFGHSALALFTVQLSKNCLNYFLFLLFVLCLARVYQMALLTRAKVQSLLNVNAFLLITFIRILLDLILT